MMLSLRDFWTRHRRKAFVSAGVLGSGYFLYKLYGAHKQRLCDLEKELRVERETNELIKAQLQDHFWNIQRIADSTTLPYAINNLRNRISEDLDLSHLMKRLMQGKGQPNSLTSFEKLELWESLKVQSFVKMVLSLWAMTMLSLYIRVQVNILGRHLYIDTARGIGSSVLLEEDDQFDTHEQQEFLATADYLANYGMMQLIPNLELGATKVLKGKHLKENFSASVLRETIMQILETFMSMGGPHHWVTYLVPENAISYKRLTTATSNESGDVTDSLIPDMSKLDQLMAEARVVLSGEEFGNVVDISLESVVEALMEEIGLKSSNAGEGSASSSTSSSGIPLAKLLPRIAQMSPLLVEEPSRNRFIEIIRTLPDVQLFYTLLYTNMPPVP